MVLNMMMVLANALAKINILCFTLGVIVPHKSEYCMPVI